jgi:Transposase DDE domain group 1
VTSCYIPQLSFSFYRHRPIRADFSGGQISSDAGLLPLRAFDQRYGLTRGLAEHLCDPREEERVGHSVLSLFRQRLYQIIAGYEDANDADRLRHDPAFQILADHPLGEPLGSQPTLSRWENSPSPREPLKLQDALLDWFVRICGEQVRKRGEILLDVDSTDDPTYGQQQLSFFNGGYDQHMYHPLLIFVSVTPVVCWPPDCVRAGWSVTPASSPCCYALGGDGMRHRDESQRDSAIFQRTERELAGYV